MNHSKISSNLNRKGSHKLSEYLHIPMGYENFKNRKKLHLTCHHQESRLQSDVTETNATREAVISSFYDSFQFVDRLTNNKMVYRNVRMGSNSLIQFPEESESKPDERPHVNSLLQIYKKTKNFQMKSLKEKIFKKIDCGIQPSIKSSKNIDDASELKQRKFIKSHLLTQIKPEAASQMMERSRKKNKLKQFLERTVMDMNKAELQRMVKDKDSVKEEVLQFNEDLTKIKCTMNRNKIGDLMYLREKQEFELGRANHLRQKENLIVLKDLTNFGGPPKLEDSEAEIKPIFQNVVAKTFGKPKRKKISFSEGKDNFVEKMLTHARNNLKKQCEFLIPPKKENSHRNLLIKRSRKQLLGRMKENEQIAELHGFSFQKRPQSSLILEVKSFVSCQTRQQTLTCGGQVHRRRQISEEEKNIIYLVKNNYISNLGMQLIANPKMCWVKDQRGNNLLHLAIKHERADMIELLFKKLPYRTCRTLLTEKNNNKRTPLQMAKLVVDMEAISIIENFIHENRQNQIMEGWIADGQKE